MAARLQLNPGDSVVAYLDLNCTLKGMGFVRYIGFIPEYGMKQHVGIELIESIPHGNNGTVNNIQYFNVTKGYGLIIPITNVIKKLTASEVLLKLKDSIIQISNYMNIIQDKNKEIEQYKETQIQLKSIISLMKSSSSCSFTQSSKAKIRFDLTLIYNTLLL